MVLGVFFCVLLASSLAQQACYINATRTDCGHVGTNQQECEASGCCWSPLNPNPGNRPWCFFKTAPSPGCSTNPPCSGHGSCPAGSGACNCTAGFATCGAPSVNDCSIQTSNDTKNCGACGVVCPTGPGVATSVCTTGKCVITCSSGYILCYGSCVQAASCADVAPFSAAEVATITGFFMANVDPLGNGCVLASPSKVHPDYYYHWQRDGAISMNTVLALSAAGGDAYDKQMRDYVQWVLAAQVAPDPNNIDVRGEPKFMVSGAVYNGGWLRPQNDGCALRSITLINYANELIKRGQRSFVTSTLWNTDDSKPSIKHDLQYVVSSWNEQSGDPWEEVMGDNFFTKMVQRKALIDGAALATTLGDTAAAAAYTQQVALLQPAIDAHWNPSTGVIMETPPGHGGPQKVDELDSAVHLAALYGGNDDGFYTATSDRMRSSVAALWAFFATQANFSVNAADDAAGLPGLLVGRYPNDHYDGYGYGPGNPWILCTFGLGEIYYRNAEALARNGSVTFSKVNERFFQQVVAGSAHAPLVGAIRAGATLSMATDAVAFRALVAAAVAKGDGQLIRVKHHTLSYGNHFTEQINKDDGSEQGAQDLTWSYGTLFTALAARSAAAAALSAL